MENQSQSQRVKLTSLWLKKAKDGTVYIQGPLSNTANIFIYPNKYKRTDKDPDYTMSITTKKMDLESEHRQEFPDVPF
jgi:hypothetical protein